MNVDAYNEGWLAAEEGRAEDSCPYELTSDAAASWMDGYNACIAEEFL
tara:strand:+ start:309 stop:452 length:144 start_codon:yes stop_codon:yes gene_type:complete